MEIKWESELDIKDVQRYSRQIITGDFGIEGHNKLSTAHILVIGAGGLGSPCLTYLIGSGCKNIGIVDFDIVELHNLQRQFIHTEENIGILKVESAYKYLKSINSGVNMRKYPVKIDSSNCLSIISEYDVIVDCCDSAITRYIISDACVTLNKDYVGGSVLGWNGTVYVCPKNMPCYRCIHPEYKKECDSCDTKGVIGTMCGVIGTTQALEVIKLILGGKDTKIIIQNGFTNLYKTANFNHLERCSSCNKLEESYEITWKEVFDNKKYKIIDVREEEHRKTIKLSNSIVFNEELLSKDDLLAIHCQRGNTSKVFAYNLREKGYKAYSIIGGIEELKNLTNFYNKKY